MLTANCISFSSCKIAGVMFVISMFNCLLFCVTVFVGVVGFIEAETKIVFDRENANATSRINSIFSVLKVFPKCCFSIIFPTGSVH